MKKSKGPTTRREEIQRLYQSYASGLPTLPAGALLQFLRKEQNELAAVEETAVGLIDRYEIEETARENRSMTFEGFLRYMESKDCSVFDRAHSSVYQDMDRPLASYFISSSHNTYLTGDQLVGKSHLDAYVRALRRGCRCLEIDCWDGQDLEPVVYHGYTLTNKILFRDVISTVEEHAFEVSAYPVILSLENHCCRKQQEVMAHYLRSILGDKLMTAPLDRPNTGELPSPNDLKYKILIKNKKIKHQPQREDAAETVESADEVEDEEEEDEEEEEEEWEEDENEEEEEEEEEKEEEAKEREKDRQKRLKTWLKRAGSRRKKKKKKQKVKVAAALSDLVLYTGSVKFVSFSHSKDNQNCYENTSMSEKKALKLAKASGADFVLHNQKFLSRIYPAGSRTSSSNFNPQDFWNVGAQLVALNFQSRGLPMDLNEGRFQDNGGCGYVLKPAVLMSSQRGFDPGCSQDGLKPVHLLLKVISGSNLPGLKNYKALDPFVRVEIHGIGADSCRKTTRTVKNNSANPHWDADMNFSIKVPELCLLRFCVRHQSGLLKSEFVAQYTLPFSSLKKGYRWVPLLGRDGCSLDPASLYVFVWYS